jgi:geranylgeranyl pyrophosphate synthase
LLSQEAALKYFLLGAFSSAFFLMGSAFLYGYSGSLHLNGIADAVYGAGGNDVFLLIGLVFLAVGLLFKVGAVPFHNWTPDVYQGAPTPITGFMAACTKVAAFGAMLRIFYAAFEGDAWQWQIILGVIAVITMIFGAVAAIGQRDIKRILAFSSIAHAGFLLIAVVALNQGALAAALFYFVIYGFATIGAFGVVTLVRDSAGEVTDVNRWVGLGKKSPIVATVFSLFLLSMAGIPLTAGFVGKFGLFTSAYVTGHIYLVIAGVLSSAIAVFFYARIVLMLFFADATTETAVSVVIPSTMTRIAIGICAAATLVLGVAPTLVFNSNYFCSIPSLMSRLGIPNIDPLFEAELYSRMDEVEKLIRRQVEGKYDFVVDTSRHLVDAGGKRLRPLLTLISSYFGNPKAKGIIESAVVCELTHLGTLYHDDVMDEAPMRRGVPSANSRWNNSVAILTGDYLFAKVSQLLADLGPEAVRLQATTFERLVIGQIMETQGSTKGMSPLEHYLAVIADKTGSLIAASARYGGMISGADAKVTDSLTSFGESMGAVFQLADDIIDIASDSKDSGKTPGTDLREGVPTLVTIHAIESKDKSDEELKKLLSAPIKDEETIQQVIKTLRTHKAMEQSREVIQKYAAESRKHLSNLPSGKAKDALVSLSDAVVSRTS